MGDKKEVIEMSLRVLIIEDELDTATSMRNKLSRANIESSLAGNGVEGLTLLEEEEPDLILTDIAMPIMDGYTLCQRLQERGVLSKIPVIVLTAYGNRQEEFKEFGIAEFLEKPFDGAQMLEVIEKTINKTTQAKHPKAVMIADNQHPGFQIALKQFLSLGYQSSIASFTPGSGMVEEVLRVRPAVLLLEATMENPPIDKVIRTFRSYVALRDMAIVLYFKERTWSEREKINKKETKHKAELKNLCLQEGATKFVESLDMETCLSILFEYCKT
jgi:CheY-like chemotaxis protein